MTAPFYKERRLCPIHKLNPTTFHFSLKCCIKPGSGHVYVCQGVEFDSFSIIYSLLVLPCLVICFFLHTIICLVSKLYLTYLKRRYQYLIKCTRGDFGITNIIKIRSLIAPDYVAHMCDITKPSCNNVAPVTNLCLGRATTRSHSSQWNKTKVAVET